MISKWDMRFLRIAKEAASWSKDPRSKIGAAISRYDNTLVTVGFNGFPPRMNDDLIIDRDFKNKCVLHAEENAILTSRDATLQGCTMYVWGLHPCGFCASRIARVGINRVVCVEAISSPAWSDSFEVATTVFRETGVSVEKVSLEDFTIDEYNHKIHGTS